MTAVQPGTPATSDELVERVAAAMCNADTHGIPWKRLASVGYIRRARYLRFAEVAIAAVRPLIEADAREDEQRQVAVYIDAVTADVERLVAETRADERSKIADAIDAAALAHHAKNADYSEAYYDGMDDAAGIARGDL